MIKQENIFKTDVLEGSKDVFDFDPVVDRACVTRIIQQGIVFFDCRSDGSLLSFLLIVTDITAIVVVSESCLAIRIVHGELFWVDQPDVCLTWGHNTKFEFEVVAEAERGFIQSDFISLV